MPFLVGEDDILLSIIAYLKQATVTIKDITGVTDFLEDTISNLYPTLSVEPKDMSDMESAAFPRVAIQKGAVVGGMTYYSAMEFQWTITVEIDATYESDGVVDHDLSLAQRYQLETALRQVFGINPSVPLSSFTYDGQAPVTNGYIKCNNWDSFPNGPYGVFATMIVTGKVFPL